MTKRNRTYFVLRSVVPKRFGATLLFFALAFFFEFFLVYSFQGFGLIDKTAWFGSYQFPVTLWTFTLTISPLLHLLPIAVIIVLACSWAYLKKCMPHVPTKVEYSKRSLSKRDLTKHRFRIWRRFSKKLNRKLKEINARFKQIKGIPYVSTRLHFANATARSAVIILAVFISFSFFLYFVVYPDLIYNWVVWLYQWNPSFLGFVRSTTDWARGFGDVFAAAFIVVAPSFHIGFVNAGETLTGSIVHLDVASKYLLSQNVAALASAIVALVYGIYVSSQRRRRR